MTSTGILLKPHLVNQLALNGELAWFIVDDNPSTGYSWRFRPDNSGVYDVVETISLHPRTEGIHAGTPGSLIWKVQGVRSGKGTILFEEFAQGSSSPSTTIAVTIKVG